ncbi:MAG: 3-keto-5-aminohexanoate cleavage protein [Deltaproteobacteria bacterium]|nr:MAG: 3-keto-5-aminohexanoate cleavage protein [Deltaproteobacteria bacterium]
MNKKVVISAAITGSIHTPSMSPHLPITPEQIAQEAIDAARAGAAVVHIHARNPENGMPSADLELFKRIIEKIRSESDVILCTTTGGGVGMTVEQRMGVVPEFKPELASFNMGSINFGIFPLAEKVNDWKYDWEKPYLESTKGFVFTNYFKDMEIFCKRMREARTKPELEVYDVGHIYNTAYLLSKGMLDPPIYLQFVMGVLGGIQATLYDLLHLKQVADRTFGEKNYRWSAFGTGRMEFPICTTAALLGGACRVGLEDNLFISKGVLARSNAELVEKMVRIIGEYSLEPATPDEARKMLAIPGR